MGPLALAAKKKRPNRVILILMGDDYAETVECENRASAERFAARVNTLSAASAAPTPPPPGWYDNPGDPDSLRWWDGQQWAAHTRKR